MERYIDSDEGLKSCNYEHPSISVFYTLLLFGFCLIQSFYAGLIYTHIHIFTIYILIFLYIAEFAEIEVVNACENMGKPEVLRHPVGQLGTLGNHWVTNGMWTTLQDNTSGW